MRQTINPSDISFGTLIFYTIYIILITDILAFNKCVATHLYPDVCAPREERIEYDWYNVSQLKT